MRPGAAVAELSRGRVRGPGAGPERAGGRGTACRTPSPRLSRTASPRRRSESGARRGRGSRVERGKGVGEEELRNGGRAGRETFDRFVDCKGRKLPRNEGVWGTGGVRRKMLERGPREGILLGRWVLLGGMSNSTVRLADSGGVTSYPPTSAPHAPFPAFP